MYKPELTIVIDLHPLQAVNCCRNSQLIVDKDELKWLQIKKNLVIIKTVPWKFSFKSPCRCRKLSHSSKMRNDDLMHHEGLKV